MTFFELVEYLSVNVLLPVGGLLMAVFAGWLMSKSSSLGELKSGRIGYMAWKIGARYIAPAGVIIILLHSAFGLWGS